MCIKCRLIGAVANCSESGSPSDLPKIIAELGSLDSTLQSTPVDERANSYLSGTLAQLRANGKKRSALSLSLLKINLIFHLLGFTKRTFLLL
jgi:hypothetical protein